MIVRRRRVDRFTIVPNDVLRDVRLSWKARGLLAYLLSLPDDWRTSSDRLARLGPDGRDAVRSGLRELEELGYLVRRRIQSSTGRWSTELIITDEPVDTFGDAMGTTRSTDAGKPDVGKSGALGTTDHVELIGTDSETRTRATCELCHGATWIVAVDLSEVTPCPVCRR